MDADLKKTLQTAANEIRYLRGQNQLMAARLDMFDKMHLMFTTVPQQQNMGMSEDVAWKIDKLIEADKQNAS